MLNIKLNSKGNSVVRILELKLLLVFSCAILIESKWNIQHFSVRILNLRREAEFYIEISIFQPEKKRRIGNSIPMSANLMKSCNVKPHHSVSWKKTPYLAKCKTLVAFVRQLLMDPFKSWHNSSRGLYTETVASSVRIACACSIAIKDIILP